MNRFFISLICAIFIISLIGCSAVPSVHETGVETSQQNDPEPEKPTSSNSTAPLEQKEDDLSLETFSLSQVQEDFKMLRDSIEQQNPLLFTDKAELSLLMDTQYNLLKDNMNINEFYQLISPIVAKISCGHTFIQIPKSYKNDLKTEGKYIPLGIKIIDNKAFVYQSFFPDKIPAGAEIISINGNNSQDIIQVLLDNIQSDGNSLTAKYSIINNGFMNGDGFFDFYYHYIESPENFIIEFKETSDGEILSTTVSAVKKDQLSKKLDSFVAFDQREVALLDQQFEEKFAVLTIKSFMIDENRFKEFIDAFFKEIAAKKTPNLILDLRDNWGGNPNCSSYLFSYLIQKAQPFLSKNSGGFVNLEQPVVPAKLNFKGNTYALINGASFSATGLLCALLSYHGIATFIGEESGGSYICTAMSKNVFLRNTGFVFMNSTVPIEAAVSGLTFGRGILPDIAVTTTIEDHIKNNDPVKQCAIDIIIKD